SILRLIGLVSLISTALSAVEPEVLTIDFAKAVESRPSWAQSYEVLGGETEDGAWRVQQDAAVGLGQLDIMLNPSAGIPALAITISFEDLPGTDLSIHLYNSDGGLVAVDLFGNLAESARAGRTDTFIVPLSKYPDAVRLSVRRIKGPLEVRGLVAFPVLDALDDLTLAQKEDFARLLGGHLAETEPGGALRTQSGHRQSAGSESVLQAADYPGRSWRDSLPEAGAFSTYCSGTCYRFFSNLYLSLFSGIRSADKVRFVSSDVALAGLISGRTSVALMSQPPDDAQRAAFQSKFGYPMIEVPVGLDAVEILVHPSNKLPSISFETLKIVFAEDNTGVKYWDKESGLSGPILLSGGNPAWGTSQFFSRRVLGGEPFRASMAQLDVAFARGVEDFVSQNRNAIGFAQHRVRTLPVRVLPLSENSTAPVAVDAVTVNDGSYPLTRNLYLVLATDNPLKLPEAVRRFADLLLSREGQSAVADAGSFPLSASAVRLARQQLKLP
ncbi:MAG: PstS family phosphate ABC transporter substrate-binding protein, partial [Terrimicrobiaceae bacterium]